MKNEIKRKIGSEMEANLVFSVSLGSEAKYLMLTKCKEAKK
jgi:hypothetical protein